MVKDLRSMLGLALALFTMAQPAATQPQPAPEDFKSYLPSTISSEARARLIQLRGIKSDDAPLPSDPAVRQAKRAAFEKVARSFIAPYIKDLGTSALDARLGGVDVVDVRPKNYRDDGTLLLYVHGGGFVSFSAHSSLVSSAAMAAATGKRVISIDYTLAPDAKWDTITDQVISVYKAVLAEGRAPASIGLFGESAGATIWAGAVLKMRDLAVPLPGALLLMSPLTDFTDAGDTRVTLVAADPSLSTGTIREHHSLYADPVDWKSPYVSPVFGDFTKAYPPVLIQGGTKEMLLSDAVRLNRAIKDAGGQSELDLYEGMPHAFQGGLVGTPESTAAFSEAAQFWRRTLRASAR